MAIVISGVNNNDKITASDGTIDLLSGVNYTGIITAPSINVGSNIQLGNAGVATATTFVGNLTGNVNATSNLLLQIGGSEKFRVASSGQLGIGGANYGSSGQVLTSGGSGSAATWSTIDLSAVTGATGDFSIADKIIHTGDTNTTIRFPADDTFRVETAGSTRLDIHSDGRFRVGCTAQPSGTVGGFQLDMGSYPGTLRLMSGAGASGTQSASVNIGGSNYNASLAHGSNAGASLSLFNYNTTDGNSTAVSFHNSNSLAIARILGHIQSHSSRVGNLVFMTSDGSHPVEKARLTHDGRFGINETSPDYMLHLSGSVPAICLEDTDGTHGQAIIEQNNDNLKIRQDAGNASSGSGSNIRFEVDASEKVRITPSTVLSATSFVSKATADVNVTINTSSGFTANTYVTVINHGVLEEESVYIISFKWNHGSSGQQPYFSHGAFVFNPSEVNTGSTGGQGQNHIPFQGHHMHTGVNRYWSFRYYGATGGTSVHGLQAAFDQTLGNGTFTIRATKIAKVTTI